MIKKGEKEIINYKLELLHDPLIKDVINDVLTASSSRSFFAIKNNTIAHQVIEYLKNQYQEQIKEHENRK
jgi:hypothetical protein